VIRGDDHLTNAFRQTQLFAALGWPRPEFAHIPLIHGSDGAKLSKRHGALGVEAYRDLGYLPEALRNYLLRLGWAHGDDEVISTEQAVAWFDLDGVGRSPARFDFAKLDNLNGHYIRESADADLAGWVAARLQAETGQALDDEARERLRRAMPGLKQRAKTIKELAENGAFYVASRPLEMSGKAAKLLPDEGRARLGRLLPELERLDDWSEAALEAQVRAFAEAEDCKLGQIAQPLRAALSGSHASPGIFEVMAILGRSESLARISDQQTAS